MINKKSLKSATRRIYMRLEIEKINIVEYMICVFNFVYWCVYDTNYF